MHRWRSVLLVALSLAIGGCGTAGTSTSPTQPSPSAVPASSLAATPSLTPIPTLASTTVTGSEAPVGAIPIAMTGVNGEPKFLPGAVTAKAGTVVFFLENVPAGFSPDHNMRIGPAIGEVLASTPDIRANETVIFTVNGLTPGTYRFWCSIAYPGGGTHASNGMVGVLTITP